MTATALHPSEITFTCPPWCNRTREQHLEDLGEQCGQVFHQSADHEGDTGWAVALSSFTYPDGTPADDPDVRVNVEVPDCDLTPSQARALVQAIVTATAEAQR